MHWLIAGSGIAHAEMFPLLEEGTENPTELFQIWLNLPRRSKFARPHFSMFWNSQVPRVEQRDAAGRGVAAAGGLVQHGLHRVTSLPVGSCT